MIIYIDLEEQYRKIYRYCYFKLQHQQLAEDITQETFLKFYESNQYVEAGKKVRYLYKIAHNLCVDLYRKEKIDTKPLTDELFVEDTEEEILTSIVLDEPTAGLDPKERVRFRNLIAELGKTSIVILSTHVVSDIEHIDNTVLMMKNGQFIYQGKWQEQQGDLEAFYLQQFEED